MFMTINNATERNPMIKKSIALIGLLISIGTHSATLKVDQDGTLIGASGVDVNGTLYNVSFQDGSCFILFNGCDDNTDFTFGGNKELGVIASQALIDQVLLDSDEGDFDSVSRLTNGCDNLWVCYISTVVVTYGGSTLAYDAVNHSILFGVSDRVDHSNSGVLWDSTWENQRVYAVWR